MAAELITLTPRGMYCAAGDFHIDPWRGVPNAVLTHGHADHARSGSARYHTTRSSAGLLRERLGANAPLELHQEGEGFRLGDARVSLHPAGHILGSAQVRVEVNGEVWVMTGDFKRAPDPTCAPFEIVECDTLITEATFAYPIYRWSAPERVVGEIWRWWERAHERQETCVLLCYSLGKAQRVLAELTRWTTRPVYVHGAMVKLIEVYRAAGIEMLPTLPVSEEPKGRDYLGELILAPPSVAGAAWMKRFKRVSLGFASGWMAVRGRRRRGYDRGFVLSDHADWPGLIQTVKDCGAKRVLATHGHSDLLVRYLNQSGIEAAALKTELGGEE
jgi:putative mRNA 3-end processing factor